MTLLPIYLCNLLLVLGGLALLRRLAATSTKPWLWAPLVTTFLVLDACLLLWFDCTIRPLLFFCGAVFAGAWVLPAEPVALLSRSLGRARFAIYALSVLTAAALFYLYLPITTFLTSPGEVAVHLEYLLTVNARSVMTVFYTAALLYSLGISERVRSALAFLALTALVLSLLCAYVLPFGYPMMNGLMFERLPLERSTLVLRGFVDVVAVLIVALGTSLLLVRLRPRAIILGLILTNLSLTLAAAIGVASDATTPETKGSGEQDMTRPVRLSKSKPNVLIVFLDRFMGAYVEGTVERNPALREKLQGFTWFPRTVAPGENSIAGVHALLGGYDYTPSEMNKRDRLLRDTAVESYALLPRNFTSKGYTANLINPRGLGFTMAGDCSFLDDIPNLNCGNIPLTVSKDVADQMGVPTAVLSKSRYADLLVLLGLMRGTPYVARAALHDKGPWRPFLDHSAGTTFKEWAELVSLPTLTNTDVPESNFNVVFNILPHEPYFMGEDCFPRPKPLNFTAAEIARRGHPNLFSLQHEIAAECALRIVADYMTWLQQTGVYDNTTIVIASDHGIVSAVEDHSSRARAGQTTENIFVRSRSLLLFKERNSHGALRVSEEFLPNAEVPRLVCRDIGGCTNPYLEGKTVEAHGRDDPFIVDFVPWQFNLQEPKQFRINARMQLTGRDPYNRKGWSEPKPP